MEDNFKIIPQKFQLVISPSVHSELFETEVDEANDTWKPVASEKSTEVPSKGILTTLALRVHFDILKADNSVLIEEKFKNQVDEASQTTIHII